MPLIWALLLSAAAAEPCASNATIDQIVSRHFSGKNDPAPQDEVVFYYACKALENRSRSSCDHLKALLGPADTAKRPCPGCPARKWSPSRICLDSWRDLTRTEMDLEAKAPGAQERCVEFVRRNPDDENLNFRDNAEACRVILSHVGDPDRIRKLVPLSSVYLSSTDIAYAVRDERHLLGNAPPQECEALPQHRRQRCLSALALKKAHRARDPKACGPWDLCRAAMGDPAACDGFAARARQAVCGP